VSDVKSVLRDRIVTEFMGGHGSIDDDTLLVEEEIIDSLGIFLLLSFIKERFGVEVEPEDVTLDNFATVRAISHLVEKEHAA
jgi:acyl carrier protein